MFCFCAIFGSFCNRPSDSKNIKKHVVTAMNPQANGQVEIFNRSLKKFLRSFCNDLTDDWEQYLAPLQLAHNTSLCKSTHTSPYFLVFGQQPSMPWSLQLDTYSQSEASSKFRLLQYARTFAADSNEEACKAYSIIRRPLLVVLQLVTWFWYITPLLPKVLILNCPAHGRLPSRWTVFMPIMHTWW